ncbi:ATP-dependent RNA helicase DHX30-like [Amblyomma americanum]
MTGWLLTVSSEFQPQRDGELLSRLEGASHYSSTMQQAKRALPIFPQRQNVVHMERYRVVVVYGETGSGKMMQGPQFILEEFICRGEGSACNVVVTQPRRTAAISIAKQVAQERGEELGETMGFQVRISKQLLSSHGGLLFCTVGILLQHLKGNPKLRGISHVIVDEVHERDVCTDFLLVLLQGVLELNCNLRGPDECHYQCGEVF